MNYFGLIIFEEKQLIQIYWNLNEKQNTLAEPIDQRPNGYLAQHMDSHLY